MLGIESKILIAFYSQTDGQTERVNQELEQYLRMFIDHRQDVRLANSKAGIKPTAPLLAFDKENSIEFSLDFLHYLYNYYMVCFPMLIM